MQMTNFFRRNVIYLWALRLEINIKNGLAQLELSHSLLFLIIFAQTADLAEAMSQIPWILPNQNETKQHKFWPSVAFYADEIQEKQ